MPPSKEDIVTILMYADVQERRKLLEGFSKAQLIKICKALNRPYINRTQVELRNELIHGRYR